MHGGEKHGAASSRLSKQFPHGQLKNEFQPMSNHNDPLATRGKGTTPDNQRRSNEIWAEEKQREGNLTSRQRHKSSFKSAT